MRWDPERHRSNVALSRLLMGWAAFPSVQVSGGKKFILIAARPGSHSHALLGKSVLLGLSCEGESCSKAVCLVALRVPPDKSVISKRKISLQCIWCCLTASKLFL